ncbi:unnamed protein product, partial [Rotaria magnacalcarata]
MDPVPDYDLNSYKGSEKLQGTIAVINGMINSTIGKKLHPTKKRKTKNFQLNRKLQMDPVHPSLPTPPNDASSLPVTSNDKRSSPANNEVLFALSPIDRPPLTIMQNRNLIQNGVENVDYLRDFSLDIEDFAEKYNHVMTSFDGVNEGGAESRDNDENEDDAPELAYPPEDGVLFRSDGVSNDKIPQYAAEDSVDIEPQWLQEMREKNKKMLAKYDDKINEMDKKLKEMMAHRKQMAQDFDTKINQFILKWLSNKNGTARYRHLPKRDKANILYCSHEPIFFLLSTYSCFVV